eukprot:CAMPEP_0172513236 /NCGR_PEP_ID=MMETSP1066-20121228/250839_1 /TAXON_ID=671091 /ORGANISM="Coscinodiscus wailesii, Strain CCMP2513" /LENGTH=154 /DNA_ID=CAMNT_0013293407 /DNA_START=81 /DNA_END=545 /DNA_ORIENTATION=-
MMPKHALFILTTLFVVSTSVFASVAEDGRAWLEARSKEDGVVTLPSKLMYKELQAGSGPSPADDTPCKCHYEGKLYDGTEFDSSYKRGKPIVFSPNQVIPGWKEAMELMNEGAKWELYIPSELGYGLTGAADVIPPEAALHFTLELVEVMAEEE